MGSLDEFARCAGKSIHTVRSQIKAAMQKTSTHTQAGLVALVANRLTP
jgi:DNA-binding CsgD family transcriptional regulator